MNHLESLAIVVPAYNEPSIERTLSGLYSQNDRPASTHHFIVDNASTDDTRARVDAFIKSHDDFPATVLTETQKGTGAAVDTGFTTAVDRGYSLIARTDSDTVPTENWTSVIVSNFNANSELRLLGGKSNPLHDEYYRRGDEILLPFAVEAARIALAIKNSDRQFVKSVVGHNMATTAETYRETGGFERSSIDELDEDVEYSLKVAKKYGLNAIVIDKQLEVATSMRRIRQYGIAGTALHHFFPEYRKKRKNGVDVR